MTDPKTIVNSWNEWDVLKHVIVGRADGTVIQAPEPAVERHWPDAGFPLGTYGPMPQKMVDKANEQLDNFAMLLEKSGIRVDRPTLMDFSQKAATPEWVQKSMFGCMPPRDILIVVGKEILESTGSFRSRWFEYLCYRPLLEKYFKEDPFMKLEAAPKPRLTDLSFKKNYWKKWKKLSESEQWEKAGKKDWVLTEVEPIFSPADIARFGMDLIVQHSTVTNKAGIDWLQRHFPQYRVHAMSFKEKQPLHIDATWVPLKPGLVLKNRTRNTIPEQRKMFEINGWEIIECAQPARNDYAPLSFCSPWLSMNVLSIDSKTICVEASETAQMEQLDKLGFEVIPVPFWDVSSFGGGLHCATTDLYREGSCEDYFPKQVEGF